MMKKLLQAGLILLLVLGMLLAVSCKKDLVAPVDTSGNEEEESRVDDVQLSFPRADYKAELNVYYIDWGLYQDFFFSEDTGTAMNAAIYQRTDLVRDYLGVEVVGHPGSAGGLTYASELSTLILGGTDTYQLILTHCYQGITALVGGGYLKDFNDFGDNGACRTKGYPSYSYWQEHGATTLWEYWGLSTDKSYRSQNHHLNSDVLSWMIKSILGIHHQKSDPSSAEITVKPYFFEELTYARGSYQTDGGEVAVEWHHTNGKIELTVRVTGAVTVAYDNRSLPAGEHRFTVM